MNYYRRFLGDYARDTRGLNLLQHGAYTLLLDHIYATEKLISGDVEACMICGANTEHEKEAVETVLRRYFRKTRGGYTNNRFEEELTYTKEKSNKARASVRTRYERSTNVSERTATVVRTNTIPDSRLQTTEESKDKESFAGFEVFWEHYPRKEEKAEARKLWRAKALDGRLGEVLAGLETWKQARTPSFFPYALRWLRKECWKDTPTKEEPNGARQSVAEGATRAERRVIEADKQAERVLGRTSGLVERLRPDLSRRPDRPAIDGLSGNALPFSAGSAAPGLPASAAGVPRIPSDTRKDLRDRGDDSGKEPAGQPPKVS